MQKTTLNNNITSNNITSVAAVIFFYNTILLVKKKDIPVWVLPGGGVEKNETPEIAIIREVKEETGFNVNIVRKIGTYHPINRLSKPTNVYECNIIDGNATLTDETQNLSFFLTSKLPKKLPPPFDLWIKDALLKLKTPIEKELTTITYLNFLKNLILHPILIAKFIISRLKF